MARCCTEACGNDSVEGRLGFAMGAAELQSGTSIKEGWKGSGRWLAISRSSAALAREMGEDLRGRGQGKIGVPSVLCTGCASSPPTPILLQRCTSTRAPRSVLPIGLLLYAREPFSNVLRNTIWTPAVSANLFTHRIGSDRREAVHCEFLHRSTCRICRQQSAGEVNQRTD
jgi:hypothetical protein